MIGQRLGQRLIHLARAAREGFATQAFDDIDRRQDDVLLSQHLNQRFGEHDTTVSLLGQLSERVDEAPEIGDGERRQVQPRLQFCQMLAPGLRTLRIMRPCVRFDAQLPPHERQQ